MIGKAPGDHGLVDPAFADTPLFAGLRSADVSGDGKLSRATGQPTANDACGCTLEESAAGKGFTALSGRFCLLFHPSVLHTRERMARGNPFP